MVVAILFVSVVVVLLPYVRTLWYIWGDVREFPVEASGEAASTVRIPIAPPYSSPYALVDAWPGVTFDRPTEVVFAKAGSAYVLERSGKLWLVDSGAVARKRLVHDWSSEVGPISHELGAVGLALHPNFDAQGNATKEAFVWYTSRVGGQWFDNLDRIKLDASGESVEPGGVARMICQLDEDPDHNGGTLKFGADGFLYISVGDEGNCDCGNHQRVDKDLFSGVLRLDVDCLGGDVSHPPKSSPVTGEVKGYFIPSDNPFVGRPGALEEFWAVGLRNPFRMSFDSVSGRLFAGDVGAREFESVVEVKKGSNHRWSIYEGASEYAMRERGIPKQLVGELTAPLLTYPHTGMNRAVIGGVVYRGGELPDLRGLYIYGDNSSGHIWGLDIKTLEQRDLLTLTARGDDGLVSFAVDAAGEVYLVTMGGEGGGRIRRLVEANDSQVVSLPAKLSQTGLFEAVATARPVAASIPYSINREMWYGRSGVRTERFVVKLSHDSSPEFHAAKRWTLSGGMAFVKTVMIGDRRVETQVLVISGLDSVHGVSYRWNSAQDDADIVLDSVEGIVGESVWPYTGSEGCASCHNLSVGALRAFSTEQLNVESQLVDLRRAGLFKTRGALTLRYWGMNGPVNAIGELLDIHAKLHDRPLVNPGKLGEYPRMLQLGEPGTASEHLRAYLAVNCDSCHQQGGVGGASFDARYAVPLEDRELVGADALRPVDGLHVLVDPEVPESSVMLRRVQSTQPGLQMPPIPVGLPPDPEAARLIREWLSEVGKR